MSLCDVPLANLGCNVVTGVADGATKSAFGVIADAFGDAMATAMTKMFTFWTAVPSPNLAHGGVVSVLNGYLYWLQGFVLVLSLLIVAGKICLNRDGKPAGEAVQGLCVLVLTTGAATAAVDILLQAGDGFASWVIDQSAGGDLGSRLGVLTSGAAALGPLGLALEFILAAIGILAAIAQVLLMVARAGMIALLTGVLPLSASAIGTTAGKQWFQKITGWLFAAVLYKPVAALVYAAGFTLIGQGKDFISIVSGLMMVILAILALPALMKLCVPMVGAATTSGGGALSGAVAGGALALGAKKLSDNRSTPSGPTPTPPTAPATTGAATGAASGAASAGGSGSVRGAVSTAAAAAPVVKAGLAAAQAVKSGAQGAAGQGVTE